MIGAMGFTNPSDLTPDCIMRRIDDEVVKPFSEIYEYLKPGQLLGDDIPESYKTHWEKARADQF